jgi:glyoxylase-like metal-dependent hydrolase (beta-lactamase superfamily II)
MSGAGGPAPRYEVLAVRYGVMEASRSRLFHSFHTYGEPDGPAALAYYFWVLRDGDRVVLVDSGYDPAVARRRGRDCLIEPVDALRQLGIAPEQVSTILVSHFHYDHIGNLAAFPEAELVVPEAEVAFWSTPAASHFHFAVHVEDPELQVIEAARAEGRVRAIAGDAEPLPGVRAIEVGGHSPGQLMFLVATAGDDVLLTSDAIHLYEDLERDRPSAVVFDLPGMYRAHGRIRDLAADGAVVIPGHEPAVMDRFPAVGDGGFAVRVG